ncbi:MAG: heavy metal translocating P-type ATPase [Candidatus Woesearchaeota archaeon]|jgi:Cu+-exporting ATPase|nr:heavy metal translocating P-type ATPase [Candidatus Woesearchaeota archaeon]MDP7181527.1 heavy metal translocating P-type ATPase [Candidatus Woesearchaeota archaeon]MDP7198569.1 heavy metal translocating P-type ATPase [Candidatus Woesearchaeota archaeon]MDP7466689.1 heavy metal translocating P-type ATPase [Candidatus Woesearchaeota archaeon]MDP7647208.1 heavy metal translocating P-type ATPase [Candidatus Woesearchaeota archaeon]
MDRVIRIKGMHCVSCAGTIEKALTAHRGVQKAAVNFATSSATITADKLLPVEDLHKIVTSLGYGVGGHDSEDRGLKRRLTLSIVFAIPLLIVAMGPHLGLGLPYWVGQNLALVQLLLTLPIIYAGRSFYKTGFKLKNGASMDTLVALGTGAAFVYSLAASIGIWLGMPGYGFSDLYYETAGVLITFILLGRYLEAGARRKTGGAIEKMMNLAPPIAIVIKNKKQVEVPLSEVVQGDTLIVKPGQKVPVDGVILEGQSSIDESMVTGESMPKDKLKGDKVIGATLNKEGSFTMKATAVGKHTMLAHIIEMVEQAQNSKPPIQNHADRVAKIFVPVIVGMAFAAAIIWYGFGQPFSFALTILISVLIIACPCAIGLAVPTAIVVATGKGAQNGILVKSAAAFQNMYQVQTVVFDKTGTLTTGKPEVTDVVAGAVKEAEVIRIAASLENQSEHPLAKAVVEKARRSKIKTSTPKEFRAVVGKGVQATMQGKQYVLGSLRMLKARKIPYEEYKDKIAALEDKGKTVMVLAHNKVLGLIAVADTVRFRASEVIDGLKEEGKKVVMITGDNERTGRAIGAQLMIDHVVTEVMPQEKANAIKELQKKGKVAMVGDGVNDAPALTQADVGIAVGSGTDIARESGDIVLVRDDLRDVVRVMRLSTHTMHKIGENLLWAMGYNVLAIPLAAGVLYPFTGWLLNPMIAGAAMALSSISVVTSSLLLKRVKI